jgi:hypothetical protein
MIGDWDAVRQPAVALREPVAQGGERTIDAGSAASLATSDRPEDRKVRSRSPPDGKPRFISTSLCLSSERLSPRPLRHRKPGVPGYRSSFHCDPCVIEDEGSGRKPLLQKPSFCRSGFSRDPLRHREPAVRDFRSDFRRNRCAIEGRGSGWKPPCQKRPATSQRVTEGVSRFCRAWPLCRTTASSCPTILGHTRNGAPWVPLPDPC